ncbi:MULTISPECIES: dTDP-4-dehydrorhamnose 3,5-epimerase [Marinobacter]|jgi:dTDP-4-dehydrorhamnose 3,5-epimerase|nr:MULTISPECIES: dTDP-4-dehydrorhamnose 3,5-epimerase [Marinobacter]ODM32509.1 dTDP-4-dehydrorhamnose 3,5-epimerase [Marinobacter adhaerens]QTN40588.1 dTDP-4-dehydrorhamnose 3,5-epimerase [Marinobacter salsuginis]|tara:strand:- start:19813 stop:20337 length:525 start_codon:yes stop_codon:yes gene_type:complete
MIFTETEISGSYLIDVKRIGDDRGFFGRLWCEREMEEMGLVSSIKQSNIGVSPLKGTLRGLHYQTAPHQEVKIIRCPRGAIYDVIVDLRPDSPTFKKWFAVELTAENSRMLYVPEGCATGYQTLVDDTEIYYHTSEFYHPESATGVRHDDPAFGIEWPLPIAAISDNDKNWKNF